MCIIAIIPENNKIDKKTLETMGKNNSDGFGIAYIDKKDNKIKVHKTMDINNYIKEALKIQKEHSKTSPIMIHCRIKTSGKRNIENCHPFKVNRNTVFAHNGIIDFVDDSNPEFSDTRMFNATYLKYMGDRWLDDKVMVNHLENQLGTFNKLSFLTTSKKLKNKYYILNENNGNWDNGIWYSNTTYKKYISYPYKTKQFSLDDWGYKNYNLKQKSNAMENHILENYINENIDEIKSIETSNGHEMFLVYRPDGLVDEYDEYGEYVDSHNQKEEEYIEYENSRIPDYDPHIDTKAEIFWQEELTNQELVSPLFKINRNEKLIEILDSLTKYTKMELRTMSDYRFKKIFTNNFDDEYLTYTYNKK